MRGLLFWAVYLAPAFIAWYRARNGKPVVGSVLGICLFDLFLGWTVVGWVLALANALGKNPVAPVALFLAKVLPNTGPGGGYAVQGAGGAAQPNSCAQCQGSGSLSCSTCSGRGSWYEAPQGASGTAQLRTCTACMSSGRLRCMYCGGSGRVAA